MDVSNDVTRHAYDVDGRHVKRLKGSLGDVEALAAKNGWTLSKDGPVTPNPLHRPLEAPEFKWLLGFTGLEDIWEALKAHFKTADRAAYATLQANLWKSSYELSTTLKLVASFREIAQQINPMVDLSDASITSAWEIIAEMGV